MGYLTTQMLPPMGKSLHKSTLDFLKCYSSIEPSGNHLRRLQVFSGMICSSIRTKSSTLEGISQPHGGLINQSESHIKQSKRWLSSKWTDWETFFAPYVQVLLSKIAEQKGELIFVIDGSETAADCVTLMLSVIWKGYAIPVVWITRVGKKGHFSEEVHLDLLTMVQKIVPSKCRVVLLGDGEFDGSKLRKQCKDLQWEFVLRTSIDRQVDCGGETANLGDLSPAAPCELVFVADACEGDNAVLWHGKGYSKPVPLLTNMELGEMACQYYRRRFKIETLFKQMKSAGFNLQKSKVSGKTRVRHLILVVGLAFLFTFCIGIVLKLMPTQSIKTFARADRYQKLSPITLAIKCLRANENLANNIFSNLSKNWDLFFNDYP